MSDCTRFDNFFMNDCIRFNSFWWVIESDFVHFDEWYVIIFCFSIKGAVSRDFCHFFISWIKAICAPDKQAKMVLLKNLFSRIYSQNQCLCAVLACAELEIEMSANPKLANTAQSQTLHIVTLHGVRLCAG